MKITAVLAMTPELLIGARNGLPWHLPEDMKHFREITKGWVVIMGRNTYLSLPDAFRPLPGRRNIVLSKDSPISEVECFSDIDQMIHSLSQEWIHEVFVIGGAQIYNAFFEKGVVDSVELTLVQGDYTGDIFIQEFRNDFREVKRVKGEEVEFVRMEKKKN